MKDLYITLDSRVSDTFIEYDVQFTHEKHPIFQAHFPNNPLLPGFLHIDIAALLLDKLVYKIVKAKFIQPIFPSDTILFKIEQKENNTYRIMTTKENKKCSEFTFVTN